MSDDAEALVRLGEVFVSTQGRLRGALDELAAADDFETLLETDFIVRNFYELFRVLTQRVDAIALALRLSPATDPN